MILTPGLHRNVPKADYHGNPSATPLLSSSIAKVILEESLEKAWAYHPSGGKLVRVPTGCMVNGTCIDSLLMGGDTDLCVLPEFMPDAKGAMRPTNGEFRMESAKDWKAKELAAGRQPVGADHYAEVMAASVAIRERLERLGRLEGGEKQVTAIWESDGVLCKARFDDLFLDPGEGGGAAIQDLKSMVSIHPERAAYAVERYGYDVQGAAYIEAIETIHPELAGSVTFELLCCELLPPYACAIYPLSEGFLSLGRQKWARAKALWKQGLATGEFPGHPSGVALLPPEGVVRKAIFAGYST